MSRRAGYATVSVDVDCSLHQFDDADILRYAAELVVAHHATKQPDEASYARDSWNKVDAAVDEVAKACGTFPTIGPDGQEYPYPPSTAAQITSIDALRALMRPKEGAH